MGRRTTSSIGMGMGNTAISAPNSNPTPVFADQSRLCLLVPRMKAKSSRV